MKNIFLKAVGSMALAILMLAVFGQVSLRAQEKTDGEDSARPQNGSSGVARELVGVWDIVVTRRNCQTGAAIGTFTAMHTYARGGTLLDWGTNNPPSLRGPGHGVWNFEYERRFSTAFQFFRYNADGTLAGKQTSRATLELGYDGNTYTTSGMGQVLDLNGNVIQVNCNTATATRFR